MNRLFACRVLAGVILLGALVSRHPFGQASILDFGFEALGYLLLLIAAFGRIWTAAFIGGRKTSQLVVDGPYSIVRHPLYFFSMLGFVGAGLAFESITLTLLLAALFVFTHWPTLQGEEAKLRERFGEVYEGYMRTVPRFLPSPRGYRAPEELQVDSALFTRTIAESALVISVFVAAQVLEWIEVTQAIPTLLYLP